MIRRHSVTAEVLVDGLRVEVIEAERLLTDTGSGDMLLHQVERDHALLQPRSEGHYQQTGWSYLPGIEKGARNGVCQGACGQY